MITKEQALDVAKSYAVKSGRGWDERYHEATTMVLDGEYVWKISTADTQYSKELPWMMEHMPNPSYYYINMATGKCIAVGTRENDFQKV